MIVHKLKQVAVRKIGFVLFASILFLSSMVCAKEKSEGKQAETDAMTSWGNIERYTDKYILLVGGRRYEFAKDVIISQESTAIDKRGNVRILLDSSGKAKEIYFNGIEMPYAVERYKK